MTSHDLRERLSGAMHRRDIVDICSSVHGSAVGKDLLLSLAADGERRVADNALWVLTHLPKSSDGWISDCRADFIALAMNATAPTARRLSLCLLNRLPFPEPDIDTVFLDFCLSCLLSPSEPVGVKSLCMKLSYKMCRHYPELLAEFHQTIDSIMPEVYGSAALKSCWRNLQNPV